MNYIAVDTSGKHLTVIVAKDGKTYKLFEKDCGVKHSSALMPALERLLSEAEFDIKDADFIACAVGAGSFTGIRIGVATVKALCFAYKKPALSITSFDSIAYNVKGGVKGKILPVIDAGHGGYYACGYDENMKVDIPPSYLPEAEILRLKKDRTAAAAEDLPSIGVTLACVCDGLAQAAEAKSGETVTPDALTPLYIRKSQAEEGR